MQPLFHVSACCALTGCATQCPKDRNMWQKCSVLPYDRFEKDYGRQLPVHVEAVVTLENVKYWGQILNFEWDRDVLGG